MNQFAQRGRTSLRAYYHFTLQASLMTLISLRWIKYYNAHYIDKIYLEYNIILKVGGLSACFKPNFDFEPFNQRLNDLLGH